MRSLNSSRKNGIMIDSTPKFMQGIFSFTGVSYESPTPLACYTVSSDKRAQPIYMRAGNSSDAMVNLSLLCRGTVIRMFPIGARGATHVQLAVVEDIFPESKLEVVLGAPLGVEGVVVLDFGLIEI